MSDNALANLPNLSYLSSRGCALARIPINTFNLLSKLTTVDISYNKINLIGTNSFYKMGSIRSLKMDSNPIVTIEPGSFNGLNLIAELDLIELNQIRMVNLLITYGMSTIKILTTKEC